MKIESIIKRPNGTVVDFDHPKRKYHFKPESGVQTDPHVCDVDVDDHATRLLRIRDGYRLVSGEQPPADTDDDNDNDGGETIKGSTVHNASYPIKGGETVELQDLVNMAFDDSGVTVDVWNELPDQERYDFIDATLKELQDGVHSDEDENTVRLNEAKNTPPVAGTVVNPVDTQQNDNTGNAGTGTTDTTGNGAQGDDKKPEDADKKAEPTRKELAGQFKARFGREPSTRLTKEDIAAALAEDDA